MQCCIGLSEQMSFQLGSELLATDGSDECAPSVSCQRPPDTSPEACTKRKEMRRKQEDKGSRDHLSVLRLRPGRCVTTS